jgi:hypothetical protein
MKQCIAITHGLNERGAVGEVAGRGLDLQLPQIAPIGAGAHQGAHRPSCIA